MGHSNKAISPLRQRLMEDMMLRKLGTATQLSYIRAVEKFTRFLGRSPDTATAEELRQFQLHLVKAGVSSITINATLTGLKFFFEQTLDQPALLQKIQRVYEPRKIAEVLSVEEVTRVLEAAGSLKYKAALSIAYGSGLRASEIVHLKIADIDSDRMVIRVEDGKGQRDRHAMLSPGLLKILRAWYRQGHAERVTNLSLCCLAASDAEIPEGPAPTMTTSKVSTRVSPSFAAIHSMACRPAL